MEKSWMPGLVDMLQAPPKEAASEESTSEERVPEPPKVSASRSDSFTGGTGSRWAPPTKEPVSPISEEPASERARASAPRSDTFTFAGGTDSRWAPTTKPPLDYEGGAYWNESWSDRLLAHSPAITVAVLLVVALGALSFFYRVQVGHLLVRLGEKVSGAPVQESAVTAPNANASTVQTTSPPLASPPVQPAAPQQPVSSSDASAAGADDATASAAGSPKNSAASPNGSSNDRPASATGSQDESAQPSQSSAENATPGVSASTDNGQAEFQLADASLRQARTPAEKARAAELLWTAVSSGSSDAEIELADVYGRGEGVRKNCQQARILLTAARDLHNPLAGQESAELRVYGCR
jgi:hypothetical protein